MFEYKTYDEMVIDIVPRVVAGNEVKATTMDGKDNYKKLIKELDYTMFRLEDGRKVMSSMPIMKPYPFWAVSECLTEILAETRPIMDRYSPKIMEWGYKLEPNRKPRYLYGERWYRNQQLHKTFKRLRDNIHTKKAVLSIWADEDAEKVPDVPCTLMHHFICRDGKLNLTAFFRSVHVMAGLRYDIFLSSFLQQTMVSWLKNADVDVEVGSIVHYYTSLHTYPTIDKDKIAKFYKYLDKGTHQDFYSDVEPASFDLSMDDYYQDLNRVVQVEQSSYYGNFEYALSKLPKISSEYFRDIARIYLIKNSKHYKTPDFETKIRSEFELPAMNKWVNNMLTYQK